jgi:predicted RNA binding protein YcfA (HicA-like mRNA interferase family)
VKVKAVERELRRNGYELVRQRGSHRQYRKARAAAVTVAGGPNDEMTPGQLADIRRKTGLELR